MNANKTFPLETQKSVQEVHFDLSVVTITYNERENIPLFIEEVQRVFHEQKLHGEIVVVDDSSPDGTFDIVKEMKKKYPSLTLVQRPGKMGISSAYRDGLAAAQGKTIAFLDADLSHHPSKLPELYQATQQNCIGWGSRYMGETKFATDFFHRLGTFFLNIWTGALLSTGIRDHTLGYIVVRREHLSNMLAAGKERGIFPFERTLYGIPLAALAKKQEIPICEIKSPYNKRVHGETKIDFFWGLRVVFGDLRYVLQLRKRLRK